MTHRWMALVVSCYLLVFNARIISRAKAHTVLRQVAFIMLGLLFMQVALGIFNVLLARPLVVAVLHNLGAAALLLCVVTLNFYMCYSSIDGEREEKA